MKRLRIWLNGLSLIQQFIAICFIVVMVLGIFSFTFLTSGVNSFVNTTMNDYLNHSQETYLIYRESNNEENLVQSGILQLVVDENGNAEAASQIQKDILNTLTFPSEDLEGNYNNNLYSLKKLDDGSYILTVLQEEYRDSFERTLFDSVINMSLLVISVLFIIIVIWVFTLLHPLNQIKTYIEKIEAGSDPKPLEIQRTDEIGEVAEALQDMQKELKQQQQIREEMIQNISHDLKTPIATIKSYSEALKDGVYPYGTPEKSADVIYEHAERLEKKVYSLITFNKMGYLADTGDQSNNLQMKPIVKRAIMDLELIRSDVSFVSELDDVYFHGEEEPWRIVVENLLDNALRYAKSEVKIVLKKNLLEVYNDGENMDEERIAKLFKPYEKGSGGNFGLGLSIVKRVCDTYGYQVSGENTNEGVVFRIKDSTKRKKAKP